MAAQEGFSQANCYIELNGTDISGEANKVELNDEFQVGEANTFGNHYPTTAAGKGKWNGKIRALYSETAGEAAQVAILAHESREPVSLLIAPGGDESGGWKWEGYVYIPVMPLVFDSEDAKPAAMEFSFPGSGDLTRGTIS